MTAKTPKRSRRAESDTKHVDEAEAKRLAVLNSPRATKLAREQGLGAVLEHGVSVATTRTLTPIGDLEERAVAEVLNRLSLANGVPALERGDAAEVAEHVARALMKVSAASLVFDRGELWVYTEAGLWRVFDESAVTRCVGRLAGVVTRGEREGVFKGTKANADGVLHFLSSIPLGEHRAGFFDDAPRGVAVANGFLTLTRGEIEVSRPAPTHRVRVRVEIPYDPSARAPRFERALREWFEGDEDAADKIAVLQEFTGACLFGIATQYQRALWCYGSGSDGKSVFVEIVSALFPAEAVTAIPPHDFSSERMGAGLDASRLNAVAEVPERAVLDSQGFKAAIAGDAMTKRRAFGREFTFKPRAGHLFALNKLPPIADTSLGFWRRILLITFNRKFPVTPGFAEGIISDELPGVLAWAVAGASRLSSTRRYTEPPSADAALAEWRRQANPVALWLEARTEPVDGPHAGASAAALYQDFRNWAASNGFQAVSSTSFGSRLKELGIECRKLHGTVRYAVVIRWESQGV